LKHEDQKGCKQEVFLLASTVVALEDHRMFGFVTQHHSVLRKSCPSSASSAVADPSPFP